MADLVYTPGHWYMDRAAMLWAYLPAGHYDPAVRQEPSILLEPRVVEQLIKALDEEGWIKPRLDERLRAEDLKITHRLLDMLERNQP